MQSVKRRDTRPELRLRSALHGRGLRFFVDRSPLSGTRKRADIVFPTKRVAVFVDGCFWHGCPLHGTWPKNNADWWRDKIESNQRRDRETDEQLECAGWQVVRIWEHEGDEAVDRVVMALLTAEQRRRPRNHPV
jgi:DNA mismatch endonuclease, patch repair protein